MLTHRKHIPTGPKKVEAIVGKNQKAILLSELSEEDRDHLLEAKALEHTKQFNHECE